MDDGTTEPRGDGDFARPTDLLTAIPAYGPTREEAKGRITATTVRPGEDRPVKIVVEFEGAAGGHLEIATRRWEDGPSAGEQSVRAFCVERDYMQRRMNGDPGALPLPLPEGSAWSRQEIQVDGTARVFTVLTTPFSWVAGTELPGPFLLRVFATAPRPDLVSLSRITTEARLEPMRGRP
ncbi:hypothetical protein ACQEU5_21670 [Marinactinospora thermotolerans]|uniref:hypothetical protein n=1 Tax=Marinactinospora thermotolerans TaxID=531310 RepID=UPI003D942413